MMTQTIGARLPATLLLSAALVLVLAACATTESTDGEPLVAWDEPAAPAEPEPFAQEQDSPQEEGEVPLSIAESEPPVDDDSLETLEEVIVEGRLGRHEQIHSLVQEARVLLEDVELQYVFTGKGRKQVLRGRPVAFALWSEVSKEWTIAHLEIPRPPVNWKPGRKPLSSRMITPGITARHVKGTGAERLMFSFSKGDEQLKVYGRKFPVFDSALIKKKRWREVAGTAHPIIYLPFTEDTLDPGFITGGRDFLLATARRAIEELRQANAPSAAYPGELLADVVPAEVLTTLAVIEQLDDNDFVKRQAGAFNEVLNHYGLKREEAYRYSVSSASAIGPMQFTNRRGNGTYSLVVRRCPEARIDPDFERGATNLLNAMKAAICLFDIELQQMKAEIRAAYRENSAVLGIFPVAAYNGGPRNVTRLHNVIRKMKVALPDLRRPGEPPLGTKPVTCPCVWKAVGSEVHPVAIPRYNNENRWYIEKYQKILLAFE
jgi:hypothetical protein